MKFEKFLNRVQESQWTKLFVLSSVLQLIVVIIFEGRVLHRNITFRNVVLVQNDTVSSTNCTLENSYDRMYNIVSENVVFMVFQVFQLFLCMNAIYNQNTIQIITIAVINFLCGLYGIVQIFEIKKWLLDLNNNCPGNDQLGALQAQSKYVSFDVPLVILLVIFASIIAFISFKLYQEFGWNIYKKIGADIDMQKRYKTMLIFVLLLKLDLFFVVLTGIEVFLNIRQSESASSDKKHQSAVILPKGLYYFHLLVTILILFLEALAYKALRKENTKGMILYIILSTLSVIDFIIILRFATKTIQQAWYFFIVIILIAIILSLVTWVFAILAYLNFGKGLEALLNKRNHDLESAGSVPNTNEGKVNLAD